MNTNGETNDVAKKMQQHDNVAMRANFESLNRKLDSEFEFMRRIARNITEIKKRALLLSALDSSDEAVDISALATQVQASLDDRAITILLEAMDSVSGGKHDISQSGALKVAWRNGAKPGLSF
jgi:hypothetical protein